MATAYNSFTLLRVAHVLLMLHDAHVRLSFEHNSQYLFCIRVVV